MDSGEVRESEGRSDLSEGERKTFTSALCKQSKMDGNNRVTFSVVTKHFFMAPAAHIITSEK